MKESQQISSTPARAREVPAAVQQRQAWRPIAFQQAESLVAKITGRAERMGHRSEQFSSWYEQFTRRLQPWGGWSHLSMELGPEEPLPSVGPADDSSEVRRSPTPEIPRSVPNLPPVQQEKREVQASPPSGSSGPSPIPVSPKIGILPSRQISSILIRSPLRLAILRSPSIAPTPQTQQEQRSLPGLPLLVAPQEQAGSEDRASWLPLQTRLGLSVSLVPRQEIRGGFPQSPGLSRVPGTQVIPVPLEPERVISSLPMLQARVLSQESLEIEGIGRSHPSNMLAQVESSRPPSQPVPSIIEQLIEQTPVPGVLPGLELRLVSPEFVKTHHPESRDGTDEKIPSSPAAPTLPLPPPLDINAVADKVYQTLQRRQQVERERRGLY